LFAATGSGKGMRELIFIVDKDNVIHEAFIEKNRAGV
jgi:hypothetical protein